MALQDGVYTYIKNGDDGSRTPKGSFVINNGQISHVESAKNILKSLIEPGPVTQRTEDVLRSINRNGYAEIVRGDNTGESKMAQGGAVMMADGGGVPSFDAMVSDPAPQGGAAGQPSAGMPSFDDLQDDSAKYGTPGQQAIAGVEGAVSGLISPTATAWGEKNILGVPEQDIRGRAAANPWTHGIGEAAGFTAGMFTGTGEAALMGKAGSLAAKAVGLGDVAKTASLGYRVGSEAVKQAAEMAVMQGDSEVSKMLLHDPNTSAESAIANTGIAAALGGGTGAVLSGVVSPLWKATVGDKANEFLGMLKNRVDGSKNITHSDDVAAAMKTLGVMPEPHLAVGLSNNPAFRQVFSDLRRGENHTVLGQIDKLRNDTMDSVVKSLGVPLEEIGQYSDKEAGERLFGKFQDEFRAKYLPIAERLDKRDALAATIHLSEETLYDQYNKMLESGMNGEFGVNSPQYKHYHEWGNRLLDADTIGKVDGLKTEIGGEIDKAVAARDTNTTKTLQDIRNNLADFQENMIQSQADQLGAEGAEHGSAIGRDIIAERAATNAQYAQFRKMAQDLIDHTGMGNFKGYKTLLNHMSSKVSPEQMLTKFSPKNNAQIIPFLQQHFPEVLQEVKLNEMRKMLRTSVYREGKDFHLDVNKLADTIEKMQKGKSELTDLALPQEAIEKARAARTLLDAVPSPRDSGTPAGIMRILSGIPTSALAAVGWVMGHNPLTSALIGHTATTMGTKGPEAIKLAYLNFLASEKPINSAGFKAAVDFMHNASKGQAKIDAAVKGVFRGGTAGSSFVSAPTVRDIAKLDKLVADYQEKPEQQTQVAGDSDLGHYMDKHHAAVTESSTRVAQYLANVKPKPFRPSPLDKEIPPSKAEEAAYYRTKTIAQQPLVIMEHVKDGTLQASDIKDLNAMYPALYQQLVQKCSNMMTQTESDEQHIPYHSRMSISLLCGQPMDSTMQPSSIQAAQPKPQQAPAAPAGMKMKGKGKSSSSLNKMSKDYQTTSQNAESDRSGRD